MVYISHSLNFYKEKKSYDPKTKWGNKKRHIKPYRDKCRNVVETHPGYHITLTNLSYTLNSLIFTQVAP